MKDGDIYVNEHGGRQSYVSTRLDLIPPENLLLLGQCLGFGAKKYGEDNWHQIPEKENLNHAMVHIVNWMNGDRSEPHLVNALARINFALWHCVQDGSQPREYIHPEMLIPQEAEDANAEEKIKEVLDIAKDQEGFDARPQEQIEYISPGQTDKM